MSHSIICDGNTDLGKRHLADRVANLTSSATVSLPSKARALRRSGIDVLDLSEGQPHFDTPAPIKESAKSALDSGMVFYIESAGLPELLSEIKAKLERDNGIDVPVSQIMVTVGAKQAVFSAMLCTIAPGDEVLIPDPYWGSYASCVSITGGTPVSVPMRTENGFRIDTEKLEEMVTSKTKMIILNSPHNPTGMVMSKEEAESIADTCRDHDILAMSDEMYEKLLYDEARHYSIGSFPGMEDLTITINGFSKAYSMTGWRLGYVAGSKEIMSKMLMLQQHSVTHPTSFVEKAGVTALQQCDKDVKGMVKEYQIARDYFVPELDRLDLFSCARPKGAFYAFPRITDNSMISDKLSELLLEKARVLAVPGSAFGKYGEGYVRFVYARPMEVLEKAIDRIKNMTELVA
ncbi:pyridoxal phosphate-dependent aminotransferase [[Eubacterium] cellulosolvens]